MAYPAADAAAVARGLAALDAGEGVEAAEEASGVHRATLYRWKAKRDDGDAATLAALASPSTPRRPPGTAAAPPRAKRVPAAAPPARPAPEPIAPKADIRDELLELLGQAKGMLRDATTTRKGFAALGQLIDKIAARIHAIDLSRRDTGSEAAAILARGAGAIAKIRAGVAVIEAREATTGACARCAHPLSPEQIEELRAKQGAAPPVDAAPAGAAVAT